MKRRILAHLSTRKTRARLEEYINAHNARHQGNSRMQLKASHRQLAEKMIDKYRLHYAAYQAANIFATPAELPYIDFNGPFLATITGASERTTRRLRKRLADAGVIVDTIFHGSKAQFEIMLNPEILVFMDQAGNQITAGWTGQQERSDAPLENDMRTKCPHTSACNPTSTKHTSASTRLADNSSANADTPPSGDEAKSEQERVSTSKQSSKHDESRYITPKRGKADNKKSCAKKSEPAPPPPPTDPKRAKHRHQAARALWSHAKKILWGDRYMSKTLQHQAIRQIERLFGDAPLENFGRIVEHYAHRLHLARLYWCHDHDQDEFPSPVDFFNPDNSAGFVDTRRMYQDKENYPPTPTNRMHHQGRVFRQRMARKARSRKQGDGIVQIRDLF